jgi:hypothetical protein
MHKISVVKTTVAAALMLTVVLDPAWAQPSKVSLPAQESRAKQTRTGTVSVTPPTRISDQRFNPIQFLTPASNTPRVEIA